MRPPARYPVSATSVDREGCVPTQGVLGVPPILASVGGAISKLDCSAKNGPAAGTNSIANVPSPVATILSTRSPTSSLSFSAEAASIAKAVDIAITAAHPTCGQLVLRAEPLQRCRGHRHIDAKHFDGGVAERRRVDLHLQGRSLIGQESGVRQRTSGLRSSVQADRPHQAVRRAGSTPDATISAIPAWLYGNPMRRKTA